jgi:hypothetical protein
MKLLLVILSLTVGIIPLSLVGQNFEITKTPEWVTSVHPKIESKFSKYDINSGVYISCIDYQLNLSEKSDFNHYTFKIVSDAGIPIASEVAISYDSSYQKVQFHYLYIWRKGKKIDKTDQLTFEMMNNEQDLQFSIYSGLITAYDILEDVRKNDIVEYAYTIIGNNPIFEDYSYEILPLENSNPADHLSFRFIYPKNKNYKYQCEGCKDIEIKKSALGNNNVIEIIQKDIEAFEVEETTPTWIIPYKHFIISNYRNWEEVNKWALNIFELNNISDIDLSSVFDEIFLGNETEDQKIDAILNYVQNDIRYMGVENGIGSFKPFPPSKVVEQRYGDCKDKSLLMVALLKKIGINSCYPALVNTSVQDGIDNSLPGGQLFNHCIVYLENNGKEYWLDPTISMQGGSFKTKTIPDYGKSLVVKKGVKALKSMNIIDKITRTEISEVLSVPSFKKPATLTVTSKVYGSNADYLRNTFEYYSIKELTNEFKAAYGQLFPSIEELEKLKIKDDIKNNVITIVESYTISNLWKESEELFVPVKLFQYEPIALYSYISPVICEKKKYPVEIPFPMNFKLTTTMILPEKVNIKNTNDKVSNKAFHFQKIITSENDKTITISYDFQTNVKEITTKDFKIVCEDLNNISRNLPLKIFFPK